MMIRTILKLALKPNHIVLNRRMKKALWDQIPMIMMCLHFVFTFRVYIITFFFSDSFTRPLGISQGADSGRIAFLSSVTKQHFHSPSPYVKKFFLTVPNDS